MTSDWEQQQELNRKLAESQKEPMIIDWFDYIVRCGRCKMFFGAFAHQTWREAAMLWVTCPECGRSHRLSWEDTVHQR